MLNLKNKKILVMGLGFLGGGIATTKWLVKHGAEVTVTDLRTRRELRESIKSLGSAAKKVRFVLGKHNVADFKNHDIIVVNPAVPRESKYLKIAKKSGAKLENEASLFFRFSKNPTIAVTGTRGKTTTVNWIHYFLKTKYPRATLTGNSSENPMLKVLDGLDRKTPVVVELSSWHLEILLPRSGRAPHIALVTNIYRDHMNRYPNMHSYVSAKANIFKHQTNKDHLILNKNNPWTKFFLKLKPRSKIIHFPKSIGVNRSVFEEKYGSHNWENLCAAALTANKAGVSWGAIRKAAKSLPKVRFREETIYENKKLRAVNDSTATSPDATIAALKRFATKGKTILIAGGTDKKLYFGDWAKSVKKYVSPENLFLLNSSATKKMIRELKKINYFQNKPQLFDNLEKIIVSIKKMLHVTRNMSHVTILFSPGATSFEKFKNEFDRGDKFDLYFRKHFLER